MEDGLLNNLQMIDSLIVDCEMAVKKLVSGNYIEWSNIMVTMVKKLGLLKEGVKNDTESLKTALEECRREDEMNA